MKEWKAVGSYGTVGLEVVLSILVGLFIGRWLDEKLGTEPVMTIVWFSFGLVAGGKAIWRSWKEMQTEAAREEREQGNPAPQLDNAKERARRKADEEPWEHPPPGANGEGRSPIDVDEDGARGADDEAGRPVEGRRER